MITPGGKKIRGKRKHRITTASELAEYFGVHRNTLSKHLSRADAQLDDLYSLLDFVRTYGKH